MMSGGRDSPDIVGYGRVAPPAYGSGVGENIEGQKVFSDAKR
jgi:spartin